MMNSIFFFFQAEDGIRDLVRSRGLGDVYKRQLLYKAVTELLRISLTAGKKEFSANLPQPAMPHFIFFPL